MRGPIPPEPGRSFDFIVANALSSITARLPTHETCVSLTEQLGPGARVACVPVPGSPMPRVELRSAARLREMLTEHHSFIWRMARRLGLGSAEAEDAAQQALMVASDRLDEIELGRERAFLAATVVRIAANMRRLARFARETGDEEALDGAPHPQMDTEHLLDLKRARQMLDEVLSSFPEDVRVVFVLFELEGLLLKEVAELLELPQGTVVSRLRRGRELFQSAISRLQARQGRNP